MKKIVALVLSLVMALSLCTVAFADGYDIEVTKKGEHTKYDELKSVAQTDTVLPHYEGKANGEWFVETADPDVYDSASNFIVTYQRDGKIVYLLRVEKDDLKVNALKADAVAEHKYVGCGDNNAKAPKDCYKDVKNSNYWIKSDADDAVAYVTVDGDYDNVVAVRAATVFGKDGNWDRNSEVVPSGHLMVLVKKNVEYKNSADGKIVKDVNEYKCYFCNRTFYGSDFPYSTPETADTYSSTFANELVKAKFVNVEDGVILGDVAYYWTTDKDNDNKTDDTNKVPSAKTFDAGVAMYVGMSLLSVAGGAVVIGKKKEF
jgi:hypothetical protein